MTYPQAIYNWENPSRKDLPNIDHLVFLAKLYGVTLDELIVIRKEESATLTLHESTLPFGITKETLDFFTNNANHETKLALKQFYSFSIQSL